MHIHIPELADLDSFTDNSDGLDDGREVYDGTNPTNPCSWKAGAPPANVARDIESHPNHTIRIYKGWAVLVFETTKYDNVRNAFQGISDGRATIGKTMNFRSACTFMS